MKKYHKIVVLILFLISLSRPAFSEIDNQTPVGEWLVEDGSAHIRILACDKNLWGVVSWVADNDVDDNNPEPSKRNRPILGLPIILNMQTDDSEIWHGLIYNSENGKTYNSTIHLNSNDSLSVKGCLAGRFLCGGEDWKRLNPPQNQENAVTLCKRISNN